MAVLTTDVPGLGFVARSAAAFWNGVIALGEASARSREIEALQALSDEELAKMGLDRTRIVHHVFRDRVAF